MSILRELKRRNVIKVAIAYAVVAWLLIEVTATTFPILKLPDWSVTLVTAFVLIGFPLALIFAWAFEITPAGIKLEKEVVRSESTTHITGRKIDYIIIAALILALGFFAFDKFVLDPSRDAEREEAVAKQVDSEALAEADGENSIAVLPFANLSPDPANQYFSDGMTEELISKLSRVKDLQVTARTSVARFKDTDKDIREIGVELGVRYVLEGSVRKAGDRVRITAQLIDASTGFHVWSADFDGELKDVFAVQEETALKIVDALHLALSPMEEAAVRRRYTENPHAYDAYLQGWALIESFNLGVDGPAKLDAGRQYFDRALALDSAYPLAFVGLAFVESYYAWIGEGTGDNLARAEKYARRALAFDPGLSQAHAVLGDIHGLRDEWAAAIAAYHEAIRLDPQNTYAWEELAWAFNSKDPPEPVEAEQAAREALRLDPTFLWTYYQLGWALEMQGRYEEAVAALEQALLINPAFRSGSRRLGQVYLAQGEYGKALALFEVAREIKESPRLLRDIAAAHAGLGDTDKALAALADALDSGYRDFSMLNTSSHFAALRDDANFQALLAEYKN
ncbi:MAG: tetratricopeptide repeat protein [Proteobacteria bacterium]|nr:tetratricopeptide repeat protein [Pseudomonadota bacterium]